MNPPFFEKQNICRHPSASTVQHRTVAGKIHHLWRAVDDEGEVLDIIMQPRRDRRAALKLMRRLLKRQGYLPDAIVTDRLRSYGAAPRDLDATLA